MCPCPGSHRQPPDPSRRPHGPQLRPPQRKNGKGPLERSKEVSASAAHREAPGPQSHSCSAQETHREALLSASQDADTSPHFRAQRWELDLWASREAPSPSPTKGTEPPRWLQQVGTGGHCPRGRGSGPPHLHFPSPAPAACTCLPLGQGRPSSTDLTTGLLSRVRGSYPAARLTGWRLEQFTDHEARPPGKPAAAPLAHSPALTQPAALPPVREPEHHPPFPLKALPDPPLLPSYHLLCAGGCLQGCLSHPPQPASPRSGALCKGVFHIKRLHCGMFVMAHPPWAVDLQEQGFPLSSLPTIIFTHRSYPDMQQGPVALNE